jgi:hypothetical protein
MPVSVTSEIARLENVDGERCHDKELAIKVSAMSKIRVASSSEVWLINIPGEQFNHFINNDMEGLGLSGCQEVSQDSLSQAKETSGIIQDYEDIIMKEGLEAEAFPVTRSQNRSDTTVSTPAANNILSGGREIGRHETRTITPVLENNRIR